MRWRQPSSAVLSLVLLVTSARASDPVTITTEPPQPSPGAAAPSRALAPSVPEQARLRFAAGVQLAEQGRFAAAKAAFQSAYELQPHYLVLYNIAQCDVRLERWRDAITTLERFLALGDSAIGDEQRRAVYAQLEVLRAELAAAPQPLDASRAPASSDGPKPAGAAQSPSPSSSAPPASAATAAQSGSLARDRGGADAAAPLWPYVVGGAGLALLGTAAALYTWNDGRHDRWLEERASLVATPGFETELARDPELWQRARDANQRLSAIQRIDTAALLVAGAGTVTVGVALWRLFAAAATSSDPLRASVSTTPTVEPHVARIGTSTTLGVQARW